MFNKKVVPRRPHPRNVMIRLMFVVVFGPATTASATHLEAVQADLDTQRQKWQSLNVDEYAYRLQRICNCIEEYTDPGIVNVSGGEITSVEHALTGDPLNPSFFLTVDGLFDQVQAAIDSHAEEIVANYDVSFGYPVSLDIDFVAPIVDEEVSYRASELTEVPETSCIVLLLLGLVSLAF